MVRLETRGQCLGAGAALSVHSVHPAIETGKLDSNTVRVVGLTRTVEGEGVECRDFDY